MSPLDSLTGGRQRFRALGLGAIALAELVALVIGYQFVAKFECSETGAFLLCRGFRSLPARALIIGAALLLLARARPGLFAGFGSAGGAGARAAALVHLAGVIVLFVPLAIAPGGDIGADFGLTLALWGAGALAAGGGWALWLAPLDAWRRMALGLGRVGAGALALGFLLFDIVTLARPLWDVEVMTALTLRGAAMLLTMVSDHVEVVPGAAILGVDGFRVQVSQQCSGIEGMALVLAFGLIHGALFGRGMRLGRYFGMVLPLAMLASWLLNLLRIAVLVLIGARGAPELAVGGFHSHAGWLFFIVIALAMIWGIETMPFLRKAPQAKARPAWRQDANAAMIVPFAVFALSGPLTSMLFAEAERGYPLRMALVALALLPFGRIYARRITRPDAASLAAGLAVGLLWAVTAEGSGLAAPAGLAGAAWVAVRVAGTVLLVPLVEELFFRGYLMARLDGPAPWRRGLAIAVSVLPFALLHGRLLAAGLAGLVFAGLMLRRGRVSDAIWAHLAANLVVAVWAGLAGDWSLI